MAAATQAPGSTDLQVDAPSIVHLPTAMRSSLPLAPAVPGLPPSASLGEGFRVPGIGPALVRDVNGRSFSVPARMGLSSSMELPGMCLDNSAPDISSLECATNASHDDAGLPDEYEDKPARFSSSGVHSEVQSISGNSLGGVELITKFAPIDGTQTASAALARVSRRSSKSELSYAELLCDPGPSNQPSPSSKGADSVPPSLVSDLSPSTPTQRSPAPDANVTSTSATAPRKKKSSSSEDELPAVQQVQAMLQTQKQCFHGQLEDLKKLLAVQCSLTGVNPLSEEMAISVLGFKGVQKAEESLTPEALRALREVYALKDALTKKEARDLSSTTGATLSQVREFFALQHSRVKRLVQAAQDDAGRVGVSPAPQVPEPVVSISGGDSFDKLLELMRAENSFTGQSRLVQIILQAEHVQLLRLFLEKGGLRILGKWVLHAVAEEQTSLIRQILKALLHLPMIHASPSQLSPIASAVNKLKFYFVADVASRARSLLTKWAKLFSSTGVGKTVKKPEGAQQDAGRLNSTSGPDRKKLKTETVTAGVTTVVKPAIPKPPPVTSNMPNLKGLDNSEKPPTSNLTVRRPVEDHANKKRLADLGKEKRKVLLVEELGTTSRRVRDGDGRRSSAMDKASRPLSVDDIQKAKMRARFMQGNAKSRTTQDTPLGAANAATPHSSRNLLENGTVDASSIGHSAAQDSSQSSLPVPHMQPSPPRAPPPPPLPQVDAIRMDMDTLETRAEVEEYPCALDGAANVHVSERPWAIPPEVRIDPEWNLAAGEESRENEIQTLRVRREVEEFYSDLDSIPNDPKDPWDEEQDYDDSLTLQVPVETDDAQGKASTSSQQESSVGPSSSSSATEPSHDPELLALLLSNPALFSQLSAGSGLQALVQQQVVDNKQYASGYQQQQQFRPQMGMHLQQLRDFQQQQGGPQYYPGEVYNMYPAAGGYQQQQQRQYYQQQQQQQQQAAEMPPQQQHAAYGSGFAAAAQFNPANGTGGGLGNQPPVWNSRVSNNNHLPFVPPPPPVIDASSSSRFQQQQQQARPQNWFSTNPPPRPAWS